MDRFRVPDLFILKAEHVNHLVTAWCVPIDFRIPAQHTDAVSIYVWTCRPTLIIYTTSSFNTKHSGQRMCVKADGSNSFILLLHIITKQSSSIEKISGKCVRFAGGWFNSQPYHRTMRKLDYSNDEIRLEKTQMSWSTCLHNTLATITQGTLNNIRFAYICG